jgi:hypothetical protein
MGIAVLAWSTTRTTSTTRSSAGSWTPAASWSPAWSRSGRHTSCARRSRSGAVSRSPAEGRTSYWKGRTGDLLGTATMAPAGDPAFSEDATRLLVAGDDESVPGWDLDPDRGSPPPVGWPVVR